MIRCRIHYIFWRKKTSLDPHLIKIVQTHGRIEHRLASFQGEAIAIINRLHPGDDLLPAEPQLSEIHQRRYQFCKLSLGKTGKLIKTGPGGDIPGNIESGSQRIKEYRRNSGRHSRNPLPQPLWRHRRLSESRCPRLWSGTDQHPERGSDWQNYRIRQS